MKILIILSFLLSFNQAFAFEKIRSLSGYAMENAAKAMHASTSRELFGNCGGVIKYKLDKDEDYFKVNSYLLSGKYIEKLQTEIIYDLKGVASDLTTDDSDVTEEEERMRNRVEKALERLERAEFSKSYIYSTSSGAFSANFLLVSVFDHENRELLIMSEGYCD